MNLCNSNLQIFTDGVIAFATVNTAITSFDVCMTPPQVTGAPNQTSYFKLLATNLTNVETYGAIYFR